MTDRESAKEDLHEARLFSVNAPWANKYIGLPFREGGRGPVYFDCWGLVAEILRVERRLELDTYAEIATADSASIEAKIAEEVARNDWIKVEPADARAFDVCLMWVHRLASKTMSHIGIVERPGRVLHIHRDAHAVCVKFSRLGPAFQIAGFYRHRRLL